MEPHELCVVMGNGHCALNSVQQLPSGCYVLSTEPTRVRPQPFPLRSWWV